MTSSNLIWQFLLPEFVQTLNLSDPAVNALQFLDVIVMKDPSQKAHFYRNTLKDALPFIPRVSIVWQLNSFIVFNINLIPFL